MFAIERRGDTGVLDVRSESERALIYFKMGRLVFVEQSNLGRTIGAYLVDQGLLTRLQYQTVAASIAGKQHVSPMMAFMESAIGAGLIDVSVANAVLSAQVERNFIRTLGWNAEYCRFQPNSTVLEGKPLFPCVLEVVVLEGLRAHLGPDERSELLGRYGMRLPRLARSPADLAREFRLQPREERFLRELDHFERLHDQLGDDADAKLTLVVALHFSGRLSFSRASASSSQNIEAVEERPREEQITANQIRVTLPQPPSEEEVRAAAAFQRGKRMVHDDPEAARDELREAARLVPRSDYVLYAVWADYARSGAVARDALLASLEEAARVALEKDSTFAFGYFVVGHLYLALEDQENARTAFERAASLDPTDPSAGFEIARIRADRSDRD